MLADLVRTGRSHRRFAPEPAPDREALLALVELARLCPSSANLQPLKFFLSCDEETNARIFPYLAWAGYLERWPGPAAGERPTAYVVILGDTKISKHRDRDVGIVAQTMMLGAVEQGFGGCMIASIKRDALRAELAIPAPLEIELVLALGRPAETVVVDAIGEEHGVRYWRDDQDVHHVPKRGLEDLIHEG
jgi:nitroreductase